jgi:hypothetical protein
MMRFITIAYIDPGTGSLMIQSIIGGVLGAVFLLKNHIKALWRKISKPPPA